MKNVFSSSFFPQLEMNSPWLLAGQLSLKTCTAPPYESLDCQSVQNQTCLEVLLMLLARFPTMGEQPGSRWFRKFKRWTNSLKVPRLNPRPDGATLR